MFGFLISGEVNDDAVALKKITDMAMNKYAKLRHAKLVESISQDFDEKHCFIDENNIIFLFSELEEFKFSFDKSRGDNTINDLSAFGLGKYAGFMLQVHGGSSWSCSVSDGMGYKATGGARKLVKVMYKKYGIRDFSKYID